MTDIRVFDRSLVHRRKARSIAAVSELGDDRDFLFREVADRLLDRLMDVSRTFESALEIGARGTALADALVGSGKAGEVLLSSGVAIESGATPHQTSLVDEEQLPHFEAQFDLIVSNLALHWVNDLPGALIQANRALKPDGLFQAAVLGGETLHELRSCLMDAELEISDGVSPRVSPMVDLRDAAGLMQRAGFALPVVDTDRITVTYEDAFRLMSDLRGMGEANAVLERRKSFTPRGLFLRAAQIYADRFAGPDGRIPATFEVLYLHGWRPSAAQPKPLRPGSAEARLADALDTDETKLN